MSVIIPVYNEPHWLGVSVAAVIQVARESAFDLLEVIVVDDGSDKVTKKAMSDLERAGTVRVVGHSENRGRLAARTTGLNAARGEYVLFVDARVSIKPGSLAFVSEQIDKPAFQVWNATVDIDDTSNPFARFWQIIAELAWPAYFVANERVSYGPEEYDKYPKGTGCFFAPRVDLIDALTSTTSHFSDTRRGSDELFLRRLVERHRFNIAPGFSCVYRARPSFRGFVRHAHHRGVFFVDGFLRPGTRFFRSLLAFFPLSALAVATAVRHPGRASRLLLGAPLLAVVGGVAKRRSLRDIRVMASLSLPWLLAFSTGIWRGLALLIRDRLRR